MIHPPVKSGEVTQWCSSSARKSQTMTTPIVDVNAFTDPVIVPTDGDVRDSASVEAPFQMVSNRTRNLMNIARGTADVQTPVAGRLRVVSASAFVPILNPGAIVQWETDGNNGWRAVAAIVGELRFSLNSVLPDGVTITRVRAMMTPASARAGANRMGLELSRVTYTLPVAPAVTPAGDSAASVFAVFDDASASQQMLDSGVISEATSKLTKDLVLFCRSGLGGSVGDDVHMVELTYTDPGKRW